MNTLDEDHTGGIRKMGQELEGIFFFLTQTHRNCVCQFGLIELILKNE
jgi:hypothetical protein